MGLEVDASAQPRRRQLPTGVQEPAVLAAVAATRDADPRGRQRTMLRSSSASRPRPPWRGSTSSTSRLAGTRAPMLAWGHLAHQRPTRPGSLVAAYSPWQSSCPHSGAWWGW